MRLCPSFSFSVVANTVDKRPLVVNLRTGTRPIAVLANHYDNADCRTLVCAISANTLALVQSLVHLQEVVVTHHCKCRTHASHHSLHRVLMEVMDCGIRFHVLLVRLAQAAFLVVQDFLWISQVGKRDGEVFSLLQSERRQMGHGGLVCSFVQ